MESTPSPWVDGPYPLLESPAHRQGSLTPSNHVANEMALAHNMFIRGLNAIVLQAKGISKKRDICDFLIFSQCWVETIHHHHRLEEVVLFPRIEKELNRPGCMQSEVAAHSAFEKHLAAFESWVNETLEKGGDGYTGDKLLDLVGALAKPLMSHFNGEILTLLSLREWDEDGAIVRRALKDMEQIGMKDADMSRHHPIALGCTDNVSFEGGKKKWPPLPWFVPYMVGWIMARKYQGAWRFCPSDFHGTPRQLKYLPKA